MATEVMDIVLEPKTSMPKASTIVISVDGMKDSRPPEPNTTTKSSPRTTARIRLMMVGIAELSRDNMGRV